MTEIVNLGMELEIKHMSRSSEIENLHPLLMLDPETRMSRHMEDENIHLFPVHESAWITRGASLCEICGVIINVDYDQYVLKDGIVITEFKCTNCLAKKQYVEVPRITFRGKPLKNPTHEHRGRKRHSIHIKHRNPIVLHLDFPKMETQK